MSEHTVTEATNEKTVPPGTECPVCRSTTVRLDGGKAYCLGCNNELDHKPDESGPGEVYVVLPKPPKRHKEHGHGHGRHSSSHPPPHGRGGEK